MDLNDDAEEQAQNLKGPNLLKNRNRNAVRVSENSEGNPQDEAADQSGFTPDDNDVPPEDGFADFGNVDGSHHGLDPSFASEDGGIPPENDFTTPFEADDQSGFASDDNAVPPEDGFADFGNIDGSHYGLDPSFASEDGGIPPEEDFTSPRDDEDGIPYGSVPENYDGEDAETGVVAEIETGPQDGGQFSTAEEITGDPEPYNPGKTTAAAAMGKMRPLKLNRQMILFIILGFCCLSVAFTSFILPSFKSKKSQEAAGRKRPEQTSPTDYSLYAQRQAPGGEDSYQYYDDFDGEALIPEPFDYNYTPEPPREYEPPPPQNAVMSNGSQRPDTRNDRLQAKSISGIKGLSPSRQNYTAPFQNQDSVYNPYAQFGLPPKDEYTASLLNAFAQNPLSAVNGGGYAAQNNQNNKLDFMNSGRENSGGGQWLPLNSVWQGSIFEAALTSDINTDLPGECTAWVTKNVYSSQDGRFLLIPQNSRLLGSYNSAISYSQSRVQIGWHTLIRPDGYMINLGNMQATDPRGASGLKGFINDHPFAYLKALGLITALSLVNSQFNSTMENAQQSQNQYVQNILANSQDMSNRLADKIIERALDIQPTIVIRAGAKINIVANQNLVLPPLTPYGVTEPYHRGE